MESPGQGSKVIGNHLDDASQNVISSRSPRPRSHDLSRLEWWFRIRHHRWTRLSVTGSLDWLQVGSIIPRV